jgi:dTDP-glucose 4,6-dehydratase
MNRKQIVVTGGYGFIGSRFVKYVVENTDFNVVILDKCTYAADKTRITSWLDGKKHMGRVKHCIGDIACPEVLDFCPALSSAEYVVNFAAETHVDNSISDGSPFVETNIRGVFNLLEICKTNEKLRRFVQISTDEVYGDMEDVRGGNLGSDEGFKLKGSSYYSACKASADLLVEAAGRTFGLPYLITRTCNNYGPNQDPEKFLPKIMKSIAEGSEVPVYGDGMQVREWMHVDDNVKFIFHLMTTAPAGEVYNIGTGVTHTNMDIIEKISDILGKDVDYKFVEDRLGHDRKYLLNCSKLESYMNNMMPELTTLSYFIREQLSEHIER